MSHKVKMPEGKEPFHAAKEVQSSFSPLEKLAVKITDKVGSMGFFLIILTWTVLWTGYNIIATELPGIGLKAFDPFPAFVAYLLISNVIQILLMPLIMVGQNVQGRHSDFRAENDYRINLKAEREVKAVLGHLESQQELIITILQRMGAQQTDIEHCLRHRRATESTSNERPA